MATQNFIFAPATLRLVITNAPTACHPAPNL
jgi:hypothetical protein